MRSLVWSYKGEVLWVGALVLAALTYSSSAQVQARSVNCYYDAACNFCFYEQQIDCLCDI